MNLLESPPALTRLEAFRDGEQSRLVLNVSGYRFEGVGDTIAGAASDVAAKLRTVKTPHVSGDVADAVKSVADWVEGLD